MKAYVVFSTETSVVNSMYSDVYIEAVFKNLEDTQKTLTMADLVRPSRQPGVNAEGKADVVNCWLRKRN